MRVDPPCPHTYAPTYNLARGPAGAAAPRTDARDTDFSQLTWMNGQRSIQRGHALIASPSVGAHASDSRLRVRRGCTLWVAARCSIGSLHAPPLASQPHDESLRHRQSTRVTLLDVPLVHGPDPVWSALQSQGHPVW